MFWRIAAFCFLCLAPAAAQPPGTDEALRQSAARVDDGGRTARFYTLHGLSPAWSGTPEAEADAQKAQGTLARAADEGLDPGRYAVFHSGEVAADDVALTAALLTYMQDLAVGRSDLETLDRDVALPPRAFDGPALLDDALRRHRLAAMLDSLPPGHPEYSALRGFLAQASDSATRDTIAANMERWRWLPARLEPDRIIINAADASLALWLGGKPVLQSRVIVGKSATPTPILRAEGAGVTVNPPWNVPHSIAVKELLPKLKRNRAYLVGEDMVLLDGPPGDPHGLTVNWRAIPAGRFPYHIRQLPGPHNALGLVKLELPNRFDVYLHDTPSRTLFARPKRALSHGCVRVEQIMPLASYALSADGSALAEIQQRIGEGVTSTIPLQHRLPVYFLYWTAFGQDGALATRPDIYGRDRRLIAAMKAQPVRIAAITAGCEKG